MNGTPRLLNRLLIGILGAKLLAIGALFVLLATVPAVGRWWQGWSAAIWGGVRSVFERTRFPGRPESWLWTVMVVVLLLVIGLMVAWLAQQGKGRANLLVAEDDAGDVPGSVRIGGGVAEQALRAALSDRPDLAGATGSHLRVRGRAGPAYPRAAAPGRCPAPPGRRRRGPRGSSGCRDRQAHAGADPHRIRCPVPVRPGGTRPHDPGGKPERTSWRPALIRAGSVVEDFTPLEPLAPTGSSPGRSAGWRRIRDRSPVSVA